MAGRKGRTRGPCNARRKYISAGPRMSRVICHLRNRNVDAGGRPDSRRDRSCIVAFDDGAFVFGSIRSSERVESRGTARPIM